MLSLFDARPFGKQSRGNDSRPLFRLEEEPLRGKTASPLANGGEPHVRVDRHLQPDPDRAGSA